ncbi:MAG: endopeptidase La [Lachnospiraceae bacterium]|nr:endopeptidase La [Lachnospiraceae bacterium]
MKQGILRIPAVALRGLSILPGMVIHFDLNRQKSIYAVEQAMLGEQLLFVVTQKEEATEEPDMEDLYGVGTVTRLKQMSRLPNGIVRVLVEGTERGRLLSLSGETNEYLSAEVELMPQDAADTDEGHKEAMARQLKELFHTYSALNPRSGKMLDKKLDAMENLVLIIDSIASGMPLPVATKQTVLAAETLTERYDFLSSVLYNEINIGMIRKELGEKLQKKVNKNQKDYLLREQMNAIREELGENNTVSDADMFLEQVKKLKADKEVKEKLEKEISRFKSLSVSSTESAVERTYIETLLEMPWNKLSKENTDMNRAEQILEEDHYGLKQVKERILEFLAVRSLKAANAGKNAHAGKNANADKNLYSDSPIICLVGPPGTGKSSIAKSVARALSREYVRISLGGVRDEAEIRGHRRTYVGAMPGRIAAGLKQAGVGNPLMLLDEIDKVSSDYKGDVSAALLEVLDGGLNSRFRDHYIELPINLSQVLFIATANATAGIPKPLLDRMELIEVSSYTDNEKFHIAKEHLLKRAYEKHGLDGRLVIGDSAIKAVIEGYTREAGVRGLERRIGEICRKAARELLKVKPEKQEKTVFKVTSRNLEKYLGKAKYTRNPANLTDEVGIVRGLAWTSVGGDTLQIEVNKMPGKGELRLTGQMGDVMKESAMTGLSYVRSISKDYGISADTYKKNDFHIHIPEGAVPKDGPSAGITMATALVSALTGIPVKANLAMTGEITLRGRVLPIGGLKEKILAAKIAGIGQVLVPKKNEKDVEEIDAEIKSGVEIIYVERMEEVLQYALAAVEGKESGNGN